MKKLLTILAGISLAGVLFAASDIDFEMMSAAYTGDYDKVVACVENGADVDARSYDGYTALMFAAMEGHSKVVSFLVESGADVSLRDSQGNTACDLARIYEQKDSADLLCR